VTLSIKSEMSNFETDPTTGLRNPSQYEQLMGSIFDQAFLTSLNTSGDGDFLETVEPVALTTMRHFASFHRTRWCVWGREPTNELVNVV